MPRLRAITPPTNAACKNMKKVHLSDRTFRLVFSLGLLIVLGLFLAIESVPYSTDAAALRVGGNVERRVRLMDKYVSRAINTPNDVFLHLEDLPHDIVIYRYVNDSLQSWCNQFTEINDDISSKLIFSRVTNTPNRLYSPLAKAGPKLSYVNMGPKWYLVKAIRADEETLIIAGLEIKNTLVERHLRGRNGINPRLRLVGGNYNIAPLSEDSGSPVLLDGVPVFKVTRDLMASQSEAIDYSLFSPLVYADGPVLSSLGALLSINTLLTLLLLTVFLMRQKTVRRLRSSDHPKTFAIIYGLGVLLLMAGSFAYIHIANKSVIFNSSLSMEFFRWNSNLWFSLLTFLSFIMLMIMTLFQIFSLKIVFTELTGKNFNTRSIWWVLAFSFICAAYLTATSAVYGFRKEQRKIWTWSDRLAIDRDLGLEIQLLSVEDGIDNDPVISSLIAMPNSDRPIRNRVTETFLWRASQSHDVNVMVVGDGDRAGRRIFDEVIATGTRIYENSHFFYCDNGDGFNGYVGVFVYPLGEQGIARMMIRISNNRETDLYGYRSLLPRTAGLGETGIPAYYSYAKYHDSRLKSFRGDYPYPTETDHIAQLNFGTDGHDFFRFKGYNHYCSRIGAHELTVISRPTRKATSYFTTFSFMFLISFFFIYLIRQERRPKISRRNYLRAKINFLVIISLILTLTVISVVSVMFVYDRNESNMLRLMSNKINTVQALLEKRCQHVNSISELQTPQFYGSLSEVGQVTRSDITLYTPSGKVFVSTAPEVFERMAVGSRLNQDAYYSITKQSQRYFIHKEELARKSYYALYAPIFNAHGDMLAIVNCPYTDEDYGFNREAVMHASLIVCLFFMLVLLSIWLSSVVTNNLFRHIMRLSQKMDSMDIHNLEEIEYNGKDEVSGLVEAYNKMVRAMAESSKQLAKAERDSAWSEMARQVAHEIKNSLTPIRLKIQKLQRLRANGSPDWDAKFDDTAKVILEHIDVLADTASGFSAIAKLYGEQATEVNLDKMLSEQTFMFDNRDNVGITYIGLADARVMAPQSQLVRVFINLITNAIQAIGMRQEAQEVAGVEPEYGRILISLRNSTEDGYYDIVVDDNGTGVSDEDLDKLFVPNFTTKSSGTGLGLSICRSIIESCNGTITYSKSFALGGACFTVKLPKM